MKREIVFKILLSLFVIVLGLFVSEVLLRYFKPAKLVGYTYMPLIYEVDEQNGYSYRENSRGLMQRDFDFRNEVIINSDGFHDIGRGMQNEHSNPRLVALGDSFTASLHVKLSAMWSQILEEQLSKAAGSHTEVVNLGLDGTGTDIQVSILSSYLKSHKVNTVLLAFYANDIEDMKLQKVYRENYQGYLITYQDKDQRRKILNFIEQHKPSNVLEKIYEYSYSCRAIVRTLSSLNIFEEGRLLYSNYIRPKDIGIEEMIQYDSEEFKQRIAGIFGEIIALSKQNDFKLVIVPIPSKEDPSESISALDENLSTELLHEMNIIDLLPVIRNLLEENGLDYDQLYWKDDGHFNELGNYIFAQALLRALYHNRILDATLPN